MRIVKAENQLLSEVHKILIEDLRRGLVDGQSFHGSLNVLQTNPELAQAPEIRQLVQQVLMTPYLGFRVSASVVLTEIGDPDGILHLTYNCLDSHPLLGLKQSLTSGWCDLVARYANKLTDECIDWLVKDTQGENALFHGVTLAQLPDEKIIPRLMPLMGMGGWASRNAAYVLAYKGDDSVLAILEDWIRARTHPLLPAFEALAHLSSRRAIILLEEYASPQHDLYALETKGVWHYRSCILPFAKLAAEMLSSHDSMRVTHLMEKHYMRTFQEIEIFDRNDPYKTKKYCLKEPIDLFVNPYHGDGTQAEIQNLEARTMMARFSTLQDRQYCGQKQDKNIQALFDQNSLDFYDLDDGCTCPFLSRFILHPTGFSTKYRSNHFYNCLPNLRFVYDRQDYVFAAINWLTNPWRWQDTW